jgi:hypothetical protein
VGFAPSSEFGVTRKWHSSCGATSANLTVITRLQAMGGEFDESNPLPAKVDIDHKLTLYEIAWVYC